MSPDYRERITARIRLRFMSWLRPVRQKWKRAAADSAVAAAQRGRNGGLLTFREAQPLKWRTEAR
jgi:hypothetical protein